MICLIKRKMRKFKPLSYILHRSHKNTWMDLFKNWFSCAVWGRNFAFKDNTYLLHEDHKSGNIIVLVFLPSNITLTAVKRLIGFEKPGKHLREEFIGIYTEKCGTRSSSQNCFETYEFLITADSISY